MITRVADNTKHVTLSQLQLNSGFQSVLFPVLRRERRERTGAGGSIVFLFCTPGQSLVSNVSQYVRITSGLLQLSC